MFHPYAMQRYNYIKGVNRYGMIPSYENTFAKINGEKDKNIKKNNIPIKTSMDNDEEGFEITAKSRVMDMMNDLPQGKLCIITP